MRGSVFQFVLKHIAGTGTRAGEAHTRPCWCGCTWLCIRH